MHFQSAPTPPTKQHQWNQYDVLAITSSLHSSRGVTPPWHRSLVMSHTGSCPPVCAAHRGSHWTLWCWCWSSSFPACACVRGQLYTTHEPTLPCPPHHLTTSPRFPHCTSSGGDAGPGPATALAQLRQVSSLCLWIKPITNQSTLGTLCK